jgi:hypothetical protein
LMPGLNKWLCKNIMSAASLIPELIIETKIRREKLPVKRH